MMSYLISSLSQQQKCRFSIIFHSLINLTLIQHVDSNLDADSFSRLKGGFRDGFGQSDTETIILCHFLKHLLALPWQQLRPKVITFIVNCVLHVDRKCHKVSASNTQ